MQECHLRREGHFLGWLQGRVKLPVGGLYSIMVTGATTMANIYRELQHENTDLTWFLSLCLAIALPHGAIVIPISLIKKEMLTLACRTWHLGT